MGNKREGDRFFGGSAYRPTKQHKVTSFQHHVNIFFLFSQKILTYSRRTPHLQSSTMDLTIVMITFQILAHLHYFHITTSKRKGSPVSLEIESWDVNTEEHLTWYYYKRKSLSERTEKQRLSGYLSKATLDLKSTVGRGSCKKTGLGGYGAVQLWPQATSYKTISISQIFKQLRLGRPLLLQMCTIAINAAWWRHLRTPQFSPRMHAHARTHTKALGVKVQWV